MNQYLIITCGLPFSGKSTLAKSIQKLLGLQRIDLDEINSERGLGINASKISEKDWSETYALSYKKTKSALESGKSCIYDATNFTVQQRGKLIEIAEQNDVIPIIVYLDVDKVITDERLENNRITKKRYDIRDEDYTYVLDRFEEPTLTEAKVFTFSKKDTINDWIETYLKPLITNT